MVSIELAPKEAVIDEADAMNWMVDQISFEARTGYGSVFK